MDIMSPNTNHTEIICVATVADVLGDRVLIHFDGWPKMYDYWTNVKSTNFLYPVGWCEMNGRSLIAPLSYRSNFLFFALLMCVFQTRTTVINVCMISQEGNILLGQNT